MPVIDHIGMVVKDIDAAAERLKPFGMTPFGQRVIDPLQDCEIQFLMDKRGQKIELLRPTCSASPVWNQLQSNGCGTIVHVCYNVGEDFDAYLKKPEFRVLRGPMPAVAFGGRRVAFLVTRKGPLNVVEIVE